MLSLAVAGEGRRALGFLQGLQDGGLADSGEVVFSGGREPLRPIELQRSREGIGVSDAFAVRAVGFELIASIMLAVQKASRSCRTD